MRLQGSFLYSSSFCSCLLSPRCKEIGMNSRLWFSSCAVVALLAANAAFMLEPAPKPLPGTPAASSDLAAIWGEFPLPGTYCANATSTCTAGAAAPCGTPNAFQACTSAGTICQLCTHADEICKYYDPPRPGFCLQFPPATCCTPSTCIYVPGTVGNPNGTCGCSGPGVAAGSRTDC